MEDNQSCTGNATDDWRIQERSHQICHHHMSKTWIVSEGPVQMRISLSYLKVESLYQTDTTLYCSRRILNYWSFINIAITNSLYNPYYSVGLLQFVSVWRPTTSLVLAGTHSHGSFSSFRFELWLQSTPLPSLDSHSCISWSWLHLF